MLPPGIPSSTAANSAPTGGGADRWFGPRAQRLLNCRIGELSPEWRSLNTRYSRNSGPKRTLWLPFVQLKLPTQVCTSDDATPSPDSDGLSPESEPMLVCGIAACPVGISLARFCEKPSDVRSNPVLTRRSGNSCCVIP